MGNFFWKLFDWRRNCRKFDVNSFAGAGNVNWWMRSDVRKETAKLARYGIPCYHVELFGWAGTCAYDDIGRVLDRTRELVFWCKRRKLALFVSVTNDNQGIVKHGNTDRRRLSEFRPQITRALKALRERWWPGMYVQPVAETETAAGKAIEREAAAMFPKSHLVDNSHFTKARPSAWGAAHVAVHRNRLADPVPRGMWDVTDNGNALNELGGTQAQDYRDDRIEADARRARDAGNPYILYMFQQREMSKSDLKAVARGYYGK
jgi:hypothetical protein